MGAGRKTQTIALKEKSVPAWTVNCSAPARGLGKSDLGGVIFGCKHNTIKECFNKQLFGLPAPHYSYVRNINPGLPLFLFNYSDRSLHGIFEAASTGQLNIDPYAWAGDGLDSTPYAAQVKFRIKMQCRPLMEDQFRPIIVKNYYNTKLFWFELDRNQTKKLISLFSSTPSTANVSIANDTHKMNTLLRGSHPPTRWQKGDIKKSIANQVNLLGNSFWDSPEFARERQKLEAPIDDKKSEEYEQQVSCVKPSLGHSYSSVVKNVSTSVVKTDLYGVKQDAFIGQSDIEWNAHSDQTNIAGGSWNDPDLGRETGLLESKINGDANEDHIQEDAYQYPSCDQSYSSVVPGMGTYLPQKLYSDTFKNETPSDTRRAAEDIQEPILHVNLDDLNSCNVEREPSPCIDEKIELWGAPKDKETCLVTLPSVDIRQEVDDLKNTTDKYTTGWSSSCVSHCLDVDRWLSDEDDIALHEEEHAHCNSNSQCSLYSPMGRMVIAENNLVEHAEVHWKAIVSEMEPSDLHSLVAKLLLDVKELKSSKSMQVQKIHSLDQELVDYRIEIQRLKDRIKLLESGSFPAVEHLKAEGSGVDDVKRIFYPNFDELILIAGGSNGSMWLSGLDSYSPSQDLMKSLSSMSSVRPLSSAAKFKSELYIFGGGSDNLLYDTVESYNIESNCWTSRPSLSRGKGGLAGVSLGEKIFAVGGGNGVDCFSEVEMFDVNAGSWIVTQSMHDKRFASAAVEISGALYVAGGYDGNNYLKTLERFDPRDHSWRRLESMTTKRGCHSLVVLNEKLFALGGYDGAGMVPTVEVFDPRAGLWMMWESMNNSRGYFGAVVIGDGIYAFGGMADDEKILDTVEHYKEGHGWQVTELKGIGKRCFFSAVVL